MLQNRVNPFGELIATPEHGVWMGNRGILHNDEKQIVRPYKLKNWLTCVLKFRGRHRQVMAPNRYTELFFMDEATAFSAGHRPCFECRRADYSRFKHYWLLGNAGLGFDEKTSIIKIDNHIHKERMGKGNSKLTHKENTADLPDGAMIALNGTAFLKKGNQLFEWSPKGYTEPIALPKGTVDVLTPKSLLNTVRAGYVVQTGV